jgi:hypothetical protein
VLNSKSLDVSLALGALKYIEPKLQPNAIYPRYSAGARYRVDAHALRVQVQATSTDLGTALRTDQGDIYQPLGHHFVDGATKMLTADTRSHRPVRTQHDDDAAAFRFVD